MVPLTSASNVHVVQLSIKQTPLLCAPIFWPVVLLVQLQDDERSLVALVLPIDCPPKTSKCVTSKELERMVLATPCRASQSSTFFRQSLLLPLVRIQPRYRCLSSPRACFSLWQPRPSSSQHRNSSSPFPHQNDFLGLPHPSTKLPSSVIPAAVSQLLVEVQAQADLLSASNTPPHLLHTTPTSAALCGIPGVAEPTSTLSAWLGSSETVNQFPQFPLCH